MPTKRTSRSRSGCFECRAHHRKCDERRPTCTLCLKLGRDCTYGLQCRWGGRPFSKSIFGQCIRGEGGSQRAPVVRVHSEESISRVQTHVEPTAATGPTSKTSFVYGVVHTSNRGVVDTGQTTDSLQRVMPQEPENITRPNLCIERNLSLLPGLSTAYRPLLDYFTRAADSFSCNGSLRNEFCGVFIPIAMESPFVMASVLNLAAVHRLHSRAVQDAKQAAQLQVITVNQLRTKLSGRPTDSIMAAIMMLCFSEVISGREKTYSWRLHLEGAASLFSHEPSTWTIHSPNRTRAFIAKCFVSLAAIANVSGRPPSAMVSNQAVCMINEKDSTPGIDDFLAYSADIVPILCKIGTLVDQSRYISNKHSPCFAQLDLDSLHLIQEVEEMMYRNYRLPSTCGQVYSHVNEAYHHAAILQIQLRVRRLNPGLGEIQKTVRRILGLLSHVDMHNGPCLGVVLYFPLFTAGCCSTQWTDRQRIQAMLQRMIDNLGFVNVQQGVDLLKKLWYHWDQCGKSRPDISWETFIDENIDLILY